MNDQYEIRTGIRALDKYSLEVGIKPPLADAHLAAISDLLHSTPGIAYEYGEVSYSCRPRRGMYSVLHIMSEQPLCHSQIVDSIANTLRELECEVDLHEQPIKFIGQSSMVLFVKI